jgi:hypothetical protein
VSFCLPYDLLPDEPTFLAVYGENFAEGSRATIEGVGDLVDQFVLSSGVILGYAPPLDPENPNQPPGLKTVVVRTGGETAFLQNAVIYVGYGEPYLKSCWPYEVGPEGGTLIHFYGRNFREGLVPGFEEVFGGVRCTDPVVISESEMTALSPPLSPREERDYATGLLFEGADGPVLSRRLSALRVYAGTVPAMLTGVSPPEVDARSGGVVVLQGLGLRNDLETQITFATQGGVIVGALEDRTLEPTGTSVEAIEGTAPFVDPLDPVTPPGLYGVRYYDARGDFTLAPAVRYVDHIRAVAPAEVSSTGRQPLAFDGYGFEPDWIPRVAGVPCTDIVRESAGRMTARAPLLEPGIHDVDMVNADSSSVVAYLPAALTVVGNPLAKLLSVDPAEVSSLGGTTVVLAGEGLYPGLTPRLGGLDLLASTFIDATRIAGTAPEFPEQVGEALRAELVDAEGSVVASLEDAVTVVAPAPVEAELVLGPSEVEGTLAEGVARFEWSLPVEPVSIRVLDAGGSLIDFLPGSTRRLELPVDALLDQYSLFLQSEFDAGKLSNAVQIIAHRSGCAWPPPLTGFDKESLAELVLYGGNFLGEPGRCDAPSDLEPIPDLGGLNLLQLRETSFRSQSGAGGGLANVGVQGSWISDYTRSRIGSLAEDPSLRYVRRLATSQFTGFRLERDADKLQIDAAYAMPVFAFDLKLKGRLIHVYPQDGFQDTFTFPEILPSSKTELHGVTYFRADRDVSDPSARSCGLKIPAGEYVLELYAEGGEPDTPHFLLQVDGRNEEIVIPGVPCPPYPRVKVTNLTGLRSLPVVSKVTAVEVIPGVLPLPPTITLTAHGYWVDEQGVEHSLSEADAGSSGRTYVPYPFKFQWKIFDAQVPTPKEVTGSNLLTTAVSKIGCYRVELTVSDPDCPRSVQRDFEIAVFPRTYECNAPFYSVLNPVPDPSTVTAVVGFSSIPPGLCAPPRRKESFKVFVVPQGCCQGDLNCPAPELGDLEFRLQTGDVARVYTVRPTDIEDLCLDVPRGPKYFKVTIDMDAIDLVPGADAGRFADIWLAARTVRYRDPDLGGSPRPVTDAWRPVGPPLRVTNRPAAMTTSYSRVSYSKSNSSYQVTLQPTLQALEQVGDIPSTATVPILSGIAGAAIPSFPSDVSAGMTTAMQIDRDGAWKPREAASNLAGEVLGSQLDGLPSRTEGREVIRSLRENLEWHWSDRQIIADNELRQRLFQALLFTGTIGPIPVTVWGSVSLALKLTVTAAASVDVTPFAPLLEGGSYFRSQVDFQSSFKLALPAELRTDILFGIASLALSFEVATNADFNVLLRAVNTDLTTAVRLLVQLDVSLGAKLCLFWFLCLPKIEIPLFEETLVDYTRPLGRGAGGALAPEQGPEVELAGGGGAVGLRELLSVPATAVSPDGSQLFKLYYNKSLDTISATISTLQPDGSVRNENLSILAAEVTRPGPVDFSATFVRSDRVLLAVGATYREESTVPLPLPAEVVPPIAQLNELKAQDEVVLCRLGLASGVIESTVFRLADPPATVAPADRRADGRPSIAGNARFEDAMVAWVRFESRDFIVDGGAPITVLEPTGSMEGDRFAATAAPSTSVCNLRSTAIHACAVDFNGALEPPRRISPAGINLQPTVAFSPDGSAAYCVWLNDPVNADLISSNRGRNLLCSVWTRATDSWSEPRPVLAAPDDFPGAMEPSLALKDAGRGLLVFNALPRDADPRDTGLNGSNRYVYLVRLQDGQFGAPVLVHGLCAKRIEARYVTIHVDPLQEPRLGPDDPSIRFGTPFGYLIGMQTGPAGGIESSGNVLIAPVLEESLEATVAAPILDDNRTHTNVVGAVWNGGISTLNLKGGVARVAAGDGGGTGGGVEDVGYESIDVSPRPDLALVSCKLTEQFPGPGARVAATVEVENRGLVGSAMDELGSGLCALRLVYTRVDGSETIEMHRPLPVLLPGERTRLEATIEMPLDPVLLRAEITPNPGDSNSTNDSQACFFGAREPQRFRCAVLESEHEARDLIVELQWDNPLAFDELILCRDGTQIASLAGSDTTFIDRGLAPGLHVYEIRSRIGVSKSCRVRLECVVGPVVDPDGQLRRGDVDQSGALDITDAIQLLGYLFLGTAAPPCADAADADDNGTHDITDAIRILGYLFLGSAPPAAPGPDGCGLDPTEDLLPACGEGCQ